MVMTLRKRVPSMKRSPSSSPIQVKKPNKTRKSNPKSQKVITFSESDIDSDSDSESENEVSCEYENIREQRMRENKERMEKLGIFTLSSQIKKKPTRIYVKKKRHPPIVPRPPSSRRKSDRLKDVVGSLGTNRFETEGSLEGMGIAIPDRWKPEVYTEEDEKLLGDCEAKWTLDVDGCGEDGDLLYDPVNGSSCHQCRYRTLRKHTYCIKCRLPHGQLCGDCLYTRYGENVLEAISSPQWMCPACRGICNCSRCRREKGWLPVTVQYPKVIELGFKSIAHYLILNRRGENSEIESETPAVETQASPHNDCSDASEWSESESDDSDSDDSAAVKKKQEQSVEMHVDIVEPETLNEVPEADVVLQELND